MQKGTPSEVLSPTKIHLLKVPIIPKHHPNSGPSVMGGGVGGISHSISLYKMHRLGKF